MRNRPLAPLLVLLLTALAPGAVAPARAGQPAAAPAPERILPGALATPTRVQQALQERLKATPKDGVALVQRVCEEGGPAAAHALAFLARHADVEVRRAALHGAAQLRLRCEALRVATLSTLDAPQEPVEVRLAALESLGWTGDARDVPRLLESALDGRPEVASAAQSAFRTLTGVISISRDPERRAAWWAAARASALVELELALDGLEHDETHTDAGTYRTLLRLRAMHDIPGTSARLRAWLGSHDDSLRLEGLKAVAALRLADLASEVVSLARFASAPELVHAAEQALGLLGVPLSEVR